MAFCYYLLFVLSPFAFPFRQDLANNRKGLFCAWFEHTDVVWTQNLIDSRLECFIVTPNDNQKVVTSYYVLL